MTRVLGSGRAQLTRLAWVKESQGSLREHVIADSDLHVMEPPDLWQTHIDPAFAHAAPRGLSEMPRDMRVRVKNHTMLRMGRVRPLRVDGRKTGWRKDHDTVYADPESRGWDAASQIDAMDAEGLEHHEWTGWYEAADLTMAPSEYFRRSCFLSVEADEATAGHFVDWFGADNLVFSTDYPHGDSAYPHAVDGFEKLDIPFDAKVRIVGENWSRLYKVPLAKRAAPRG